MPYSGNDYVPIDEPMVAVDAPVSTTLMNYLGIDNPNWLKSAITDGPEASQGISTTILETSGTAEFGGNVTLNGTNIESTATLVWNAPTDFSNEVSFDGTLTVVGVELARFQALLMAEGY